MEPGQDLLERARKIRLIGFDVDGVLTDGRLYYIGQDVEAKAFHVLDGMGLQMLRTGGIEVCVISSRASDAATRRLAELGIVHAYLGVTGKRMHFEKLLRELGLDYSGAAFMGDDLPDLSILSRVGLAATVETAAEMVRQHSHWCASRPAGAGAVRELAEFVLGAQGTLDRFTSAYLEAGR